MSRKRKSIKIFVNASTVLISGGLILAVNIVKSLQLEGFFTIVITCPRLKPYKSIVKEKSSLVLVPRWMLYRALRWYHDYLWLPALIRKEKPDVVLTLSNLPAITTCKQIYLHDNPYVGEEMVKYLPLSFQKHLIQKLRSYITISRMKYVDYLIVQTDYQKRIMQLKIRKTIPVVIIPPIIISKILDFQKDQPKKVKDEDYYKVLCPSRYYEHKNLEILIRVGRLIKEKQLPIKIYITILARHGRKAKLLLHDIMKMKIEDTLINLGQIKHRNMPEFIINSDAIILPSLLESFSLSCIEAWQYKKPLLVSNIDTFKSFCSNAALYFDPYSPENILEAIKTSIYNPKTREEVIKNGIKQAKQLSDTNRFLKSINELME